MPIQASRVGIATLAAAMAAMLSGGIAPLHAQNTLGTAQRFGVLGASAVTNTGATIIKGDLGVAPGSSITGQNTIVLTGTVHTADATAQQAQADATNAYNMFAAMPFTVDLSGQNLGGLVLTPGVYFFASSAQLSGNLFLDFLNNPSGNFVFQIGSTLTTATSSQVTVLNAGPNNGIYWDVGTSATFGAGTAFVGNVLAQTSITLNTGATIVCGRAIALNGAVTLDNNIVSNDCANGGDFGTGRTDNGSLGFSGGPVGTNITPEPSTMLLLLTGLAGMAGLGVVKRRSIRIDLPTSSIQI